MTSSIPQAYNRSCPEPVTCVHVTQNTITLGGQRGSGVIIEKLCSATHKIYELAHTPVDWFCPQVFVNGVLQLAPDHYSIEGRLVSFVYFLSEEDDVQVQYVPFVEGDAPEDRTPGGFKKPASPEHPDKHFGTKTAIRLIKKHERTHH